MKIGIVTVPYIVSDTQKQLAQESYETFTLTHQTYRVAVVNKCREEDKPFLIKQNDAIIYNDQNILSRAWNMGIKACVDEGCEYIFVPNLDIVVHDLDKLIEFAINNDDAVMWSMHCTNGPERYFDNDQYQVTYLNSWDNFSAFLVKKDFMYRLEDKEEGTLEPFPGRFDENIIPAYCEDIDMQFRLGKQGLKHLCTRQSTFFHHRNATINFHTDVAWAQANLSYEKTLPYMTKKWGGLRESMTFNSPFEETVT
jgi:GT2 family glycosyltransferase